MCSIRETKAYRGTKIIADFVARSYGCCNVPRDKSRDYEYFDSPLLGIQKKRRKKKCEIKNSISSIEFFKVARFFSTHNQVYSIVYTITATTVEYFENFTNFFFLSDRETSCLTCSGIFKFQFTLGVARTIILQNFYERNFNKVSDLLVLILLEQCNSEVCKWINSFTDTVQGN